MYACMHAHKHVRAHGHARTHTSAQGVSGYFKPDFMAVMGPSGSAKTTILDLLTGRGKEGEMAGEIFVNGRSTKRADAWTELACNSGYVLQLAEAFCIG